jgi:hypothetical protein
MRAGTWNAYVTKLKRLRPLFIKLMPLVVFVASLLPMIVALDRMSFHGDESSWISEGITSTQLILQGRFGDPFWLTGPDWYQPPIAKYLIGFTLLLFGVREGNWVYWGIWEIPPDQVLAIARLPIAVMGALTCVLVFWLGKELKDRWTGLIASLFLAFHPLWLASSRRAMCDVPAVFFSTLSVLTFWLAIKNLKSRTKTLIYFAISGIAVGFAIDSKYTSAATFLVLIFSVLIFGAFYFFSHRSSLTTVKKKPLAIVAVGLILFSGMGALTTIILNPYLYSNPYQQFNSVIGFWSKANTYWGYRIQDTPNDRINAFIGVIHSVVWPGSSLLKSIWSGYQWCWEYPGCYTTVASATSFILGFAYFLNKTRKKELSFIQLMIFMWFLVYLVFISITTWKLWDRYFLPLIPSMTLIAAYGLVSFSRRVLKADWILVTAAIVSHAGNILAWIPELYDKRWLDVNNDSFLASLQLSVERNIGFIFAVGYSIILLSAILWYLRKNLHKKNFRKILPISKDTKISTKSIERNLG